MRGVVDHARGEDVNRCGPLLSGAKACSVRERQRLVPLQEDSVRDVASSNKASSRLCDAFKFVLQWTPPEQPGGKVTGLAPGERRRAAGPLARDVILFDFSPQKGKGAKGKGKKGKKGMALLPEQEEALLKITGCLRQMSMLDTDKVRIARCGVAKLCDDLAMGASRGPLRWNSRSLLGNIATMVENRTILEARSPWRWRTPLAGLDAMRLRPRRRLARRTRGWRRSTWACARSPSRRRHVRTCGNSSGSLTTTYDLF